jgi:phage major head subunit gpT-like protein
MVLKSLSSRAILGEFMREIEQDIDHGFVGDLSHFVDDSTQFMEEHRFVGAVPGFIEWTGTRRTRELADYFIQCKNTLYENTLGVGKDELKFDKTKQVANRIKAHGNDSMQHWEKLISPLITNGATGIAYDGDYFFGEAHAEGKSGTMSNLMTIDISDMPFDTDYKGSATAPSAMQIAHAVNLMIARLYSFKNDQGDPINQSAKKFRLVVPVSFMAPARQALNLSMLAHGEINPLEGLDDMEVKLSVDPRNTWTDSMALFRTDGVGGAKPFIRQQMGKPEYAVLDENSDLYKKERRMEFTAEVYRGVTYGLWQHAVKATFTA